MSNRGYELSVLQRTDYLPESHSDFYRRFVDMGIVRAINRARRKWVENMDDFSFDENIFGSAMWRGWTIAYCSERREEGARITASPPRWARKLGAIRQVSYGWTQSSALSIAHAVHAMHRYWEMVR